MAEMSHPADAGLSQANESSGRPVYEVAFHVVPSVDETGAQEVMEGVRTLLAKAGAEIIKEQVPQKMTLAYTIERSDSGKREKYAQAYFGLIKFAVEREAIAALEAHVRSSKEILRHLLIETTREEQTIARRAVYASNRLEGETIKKPTSTPETPSEVSEEDLQKSIDALVS